ncbi:MAG: hypothetical protein HYT09_02155 [Candidatus Levybacteria bacterium]|nr:hypothetical protein [Candidatus Levybacteria bacterium]
MRGLINKAKKYTNGGRIFMQRGYLRKSTRKYIASHLKTKPDNTTRNNRKQVLGY